MSQQPCWDGCSSVTRDKIIDKIWEARKASTIDKYCQALRKFFVFCKSNDIEVVLPLSSMILANYLIFLSNTNGTKGATSSAVAGLKWFHSFIPGLNATNNPINDDFISRISQSENRNLAKLKSRKKPLSNEIIKAILKKSNSDQNPTLLMIRNALIPCMAYALLMRHDEISHLNCSHISAEEQGLKIFIPSSKTDTYRQGKFVFLSKDNVDLYDLFFKYLSMANISIGQNHFLFAPIIFDLKRKIFSLQNKKLSYSVFNEVVKEAVSDLGLDPHEYGTHSCRSGGATDLAPYVSQFELLLSGRWADPRSLGSYVETPQERRFAISRNFDLNSNA